ncbi:nucleotidyltransferase domain-containing protein [Mycolicibacterium palauense]|uniref:nucleotidyltransferase domain-containing protein n=1 Tax=Mycolicibacterium palauense TaxID=2034511 RepID=UPI000BFEF024|nr:nucleotidyltransferase domain-containing protein [Mycolicibacterium palauense]
MGKHNTQWHAEIAKSNIILLTEVGSGLHGVTISGTDDHDEMGVCITPPECVIGTQKFEQYQDRWHLDGLRIAEGQRSGPGDTDHVTYSLQKYARLAADGNPTVLMPLFAPREKTYVETELGAELRANRDLFLSKQAGARFLGYLVAQRERAQGLRGKKHTNRRELVEKFGYDTKMMYHAIRLAIQGTQLMDIGVVVLPMMKTHRELLLRVREGAFSLEHALDILAALTDDLREAIAYSTLPDKPNTDELDDFLIGMHNRHWTSKGML